MESIENPFAQGPPSAELQKILAAAGELFLQYGLRNVSMSDIAKALGMSKKTLYAHIDNKDDLIYKFAYLFLERERKISEEIINQSGNALEEVIQLTQQAQCNMRKMTPSLAHEFYKYHPRGWKMVESFKQEFVYHKSLKNLQRGIAEGLYREDINPFIISKLYVYTLPIFAGPNHNELSEYAPIDLHTQFVKYHIHGIISAKGRAMLENDLSLSL